MVTSRALKVYTGAHEVIVTIMMNYIAINITDYLADGPWKDGTPGNIVARTPKIQPSAELPILGNIPLGFILAVVAAVVVWWILYRTTLGYEIRTSARIPAPRAMLEFAWLALLPDDDDQRLSGRSRRRG